MKPLRSDMLTRRIRSLVAKHHSLRRNSLNMIPSENISSPSLREMMTSDLMHRYGEYEQHNIEKRWGSGNLYIIQVEKMVRDLAKKVFGVRFVDLRPVTGHIAILSAIGAFAKPRSIVFEISGINGGHEWYRFRENIPVVNYKSAFYPFDSVEWNIDVDGATRKIRKLKPSVLILGASFYLFPHPIKEMRSVADDVGAMVLSDEAHVLGLIAGKQWPNPLTEGAQIFTGSTHKSFPGPQKGIVMANNGAYMERVARALYPSLLTNHHLMNVAALGYGLAEMLEFGKDYARQVVRNAQAFGAALVEEGFEVVGEHKGFTQSHQVLIKTDKHVKGKDASELLETANIFVNKMELRDANGLRAGLSELTRMGVKTSNMQELARFYREVLIDKRDPKIVARRVRSFLSSFRTIRYAFDVERDPYIPLRLRR